MSHPQIAVFARVAEGNSNPTRKIEGQKTLLGRTMHAISYDGIHDEFYVPQPFAQSILTFAGGSSGETAPIRVIEGSRTQLSNPDQLAVDPVNNEIFVPERTKVLVFPRSANGNVAPIRVLEGPDTMLGAFALAVDPVHNLLIAAGWQGQRENGTKLLIFNRTDEGNTKPLRVISGPKTGITGTFGLRSYPPGGLILVTMPGPDYSGSHDGSFVGVWSVEDNGDVPPRWTIGGPHGMLKQPRGVDLDPKNKTVIISDKFLNAVLTYYFPEIF
ncbi:MAG: hypothetical protein O7A06_08710 [Acidobacteria bacterium]|nr:hypothetical protein [Acidobacteriota bacterium]MCZ6490598.1 hypothetical protein [Acidobacteriota bacterium]